MTGETLMVLKRIFATALGALGLGALAAGPTAFAQTAGEGNIPAPNIFDDQITCSMNVPGAMDTPMPTQVAEDAMTAVIDDLIGMGASELITDSTATGYDDRITQLGYVIPPMGANCGVGPLDTTDADSIARTASFDGYDANNNGDFTDAGDIAPKNSIPRDVAKGYSDLLDKFVAVYGDPGDLESTGTAGALADAQKTLTEAIEGGQSGAALTPLQNAVTSAQEAHDKAKAEFNAISQGPINQAGVAEWMAKAAVTQSIADYNMAVTGANMAKMTLDDMDYGSYVPLGNQELIDGTVVTGLDTDDPMVVLAQLTQYVNGNLATPQVGTQGMVGTGDGQGDNAPMASVTTDSNFDATGNLIVPMEPNTATTDNLLDLRPTLDSTNNGVDQIRMRVEQINKAAEAIKELRDDNVNPLLQATYDEAYRRAKAEADYYNAELAEVLADSTDQRSDADKLAFVDDNGNGVRDTGEADNPTYEAAPVTIARRQSEYVSKSNERFTAEQNLRAAVATREMATATVRMQFTSPHSFYEQLIARRQALKADADKVVADAVEAGETPTMAQTDAANAAAMALTAAEEAQASFAALFDNENDPTVGLINTLLETGGDDGQALVSAISATYDVAAGAADAARE
ncbi:MAG: hypothetical protein OXG51_13885, partial [Gammaproteobacteria bacterium]|nr:hypothetical protein [Gammaproteobacteria bacterium]